MGFCVGFGSLIKMLNLTQHAKKKTNWQIWQYLSVFCCFGCCVSQVGCYTNSTSGLISSHQHMYLRSEVPMSMAPFVEEAVLKKHSVFTYLRLPVVCTPMIRVQWKMTFG